MGNLYVSITSQGNLYDYNTAWATYMFILHHGGTYMIIIQHGELICLYYSVGNLYDYNMTFILF